ncbi:MAG: ABC transporter ATP-binding protein [Coriobacteriales bacterium]|jgi:ATP-binding cassette subfamily B multidrug efflux pump
MFRLIWKYAGKYKASSIATPVFAALEVFMETLIPFVIAMLIDRGINAGSMDNVIFYGLIMLGVAFLSLLFGVLSGKYAAYASAGVACNLRDAIYRKVQTFSFSNIDKFSTAGLITRMTTDITNTQNAYQMVIRIAVRAPLTLICSLVMAFVINADLSVVFLVAVIVLGVALFAIMLHVNPIFREVFDRYDDLNASTQENITGIRVVKSFVREDYESKKFNTAANNLYRLFVKAEGFLALNNPVMMFMIYLSIIMVSWLGANYIVIGTLTTGELTSMFTYILSSLMSLMMLSMVFVMISMSLASVRRIKEVLDDEPDIVNPENPVMEVPNGDIDFNHVDFAYKSGTGEDTLHDIDLHIKSGETIGIIGGTGSGKTTLVSLISRLYDVKSGSVEVGGIDVRNYDLEVLRDNVSVVLQKNVLFSGTILDNLRWGDPNATEEQCKEVCEQACADGFINEFPDGYNTYIEQGGSNVSGGQKQRLCIARALLKRPKVLILDDSTSAVDTATDASIRRAFAEKIGGTTKLIISQRVSSVEDADRIIVLDDGRINAFAPHDELMETNDIYREIYEAQTKQGGDFDKLESGIKPEVAMEGGGA